MTHVPDPDLVRKIATKLILKHARDIKSMAIPRAIAGEARCSGLDDDQRLELGDAIGEYVDTATIAVSVPDDAGAAFFEPGKTYIENRPFAAPEATEVFQCVAVAEHPSGRGIRAFGFGANAYPGDNWASYVLDLEAWGQGWTATAAEDQWWVHALADRTAGEES